MVLSDECQAVTTQTHLPSVPLGKMVVSVPCNVFLVPPIQVMTPALPGTLPVLMTSGITLL